MNTYRFLIVVEDAGANYSAYSPDLPGCVATGGSREEAEEEHVRGHPAPYGRSQGRRLANSRLKRRRRVRGPQLLEIKRYLDSP
jgi:hypothetical protein